MRAMAPKVEQSSGDWALTDSIMGLASFASMNVGPQLKAYSTHLNLAVPLGTRSNFEPPLLRV